MAPDESPDRFSAFFLPAWEQLPDLGLYMDQVITYLERQYRALYGEEKRIITPSMINNYVKCGLIKRPEGKKYDREHLAQLIMLCSLKQALSLEDLRGLLNAQSAGGIEALYQAYRDLQHDALQSLAKALPDMSALGCAVKASAYQIVCRELLLLKGSTGGMRP